MLARGRGMISTTPQTTRQTNQTTRQTKTSQTRQKNPTTRQTNPTTSQTNQTTGPRMMSCNLSCGLLVSRCASPKHFPSISAALRRLGGISGISQWVGKGEQSIPDRILDESG